MYKCFHCGEETVVWDADFDFEELESNTIACFFLHIRARLVFAFLLPALPHWGVVKVGEHNGL